MRSVWKGPFIDDKVLQEIYDLQKANKRKVPIKIRSRESVIFPSFVGLTFSVFNGRSFVNLIISETMVGHKFGEFIVTKKYPIHKKTK
jgi:small subunit ribosomal protein S19|tara:strand:+ start:69 stop:332 length:264 start_codon:yes stop_codon:yes gene_type:complete